jgi:hypothetical protein
VRALTCPSSRFRARARVRIRVVGDSKPKGLV